MLEASFPSHLTSLLSEWGVPAQMALITFPSPHYTSPLPSLSPPGNRGIRRYETSRYPPTLPSPRPGTMRTKDKNFHYLAPSWESPHSHSLLCPFLLLFFIQCSLALCSKAFSNKGSRSADRLRPSFCFCLLISYSFPFSRKAKKRGHRCHSHYP